jgi:hypothetical protein
MRPSSWSGMLLQRQDVRARRRRWGGAAAAYVDIAGAAAFGLAGFGVHERHLGAAAANHYRASRGRSRRTSHTGYVIEGVARDEICRGSAAVSAMAKLIILLHVPGYWEVVLLKRTRLGSRVSRWHESPVQPYARLKY